MISRILVVAAAFGLAGAVSARAQTALWNETAPQQGYHGEVVSPNALPPGFSDGTEQDTYRKAVNRWLSSQHLLADPHSRSTGW